MRITLPPGCKLSVSPEAHGERTGAADGPGWPGVAKPGRGSVGREPRGEYRTERRGQDEACCGGAGQVEVQDLGPGDPGGQAVLQGGEGLALAFGAAKCSIGHLCAHEASSAQHSVPHTSDSNPCHLQVFQARPLRKTWKKKIKTNTQMVPAV